jgi:hypothetical protein
MMVVNLTGRKTGRRYSIPLSAHRIDNTLYALTSASWKNNFRDGRRAPRQKDDDWHSSGIASPRFLLEDCADDVAALADELGVETFLGTDCTATSRGRPRRLRRTAGSIQFGPLPTSRRASIAVNVPNMT